MSIFRLLALPLMMSVCVPLAAHALQNSTGGYPICQPDQAQPPRVDLLALKDPFSPFSFQPLPTITDGLNVADVATPPEFRGVEPHYILMVDAKGFLVRVPLRLPCGFYVYPPTRRSDQVPPGQRQWH
jgi:hypothetical protein